MSETGTAKATFPLLPKGQRREKREEMKALYDQRKETIERIFGSAKEYHGFRYTNMIGKARMKMKAALTFTCINLKKLARIMGGNPPFSCTFRRFLQLLLDFLEKQNKMAPAFVR